MSAIDRVIGNRIVYNQTELKYVLQQLHRHRWETWKISQDSVKAKNDKKRKGTNSRRSDVSNLIVKIYHITIMFIKLFHFKEKEKVKTRYDDILINYRPDSLQKDNYIADIEVIIENGAYHSDEVSETDDEKTQEEVSRHIQPKNKNESDHHII